MSDESAQWTVDLNGDGTGVLVTFDVLGEAGIEVFTTAIPIRAALDFGAAVLNHALAAVEDM